MQQEALLRRANPTRLPRLAPTVTGDPACRGEDEEEAKAVPQEAWLPPPRTVRVRNVGPTYGEAQ